MDAYFVRTLQMTGWVSLFVVCLLLQCGQWWALLPFLAGVALAVVLLLGWNAFIGFLVAQYLQKSIDRRGASRRFVWFALVKYPLVGLWLWYIASHWETRSIVVFVGGFLLLQIVMALRALGRVVTDRPGTA